MEESSAEPVRSRGFVEEKKTMISSAQESQGGQNGSKLCISSTSITLGGSLEGNTNANSILTSGLGPLGTAGIGLESMDMISSGVVSTIGSPSVGTLSAIPPCERPLYPPRYSDTIQNRCTRPRKKSGSDVRDAVSASTEELGYIGGGMSKNMAADYGPSTHTAHSQGESQLVMPQYKRSTPINSSSSLYEDTSSLALNKSPLNKSPLNKSPLAQTQVATSNHFRKNANAQILRPYDNEPDHRAVKLAADCLHAQDYSRMVIVLTSERSTIAVLFGRALAYYKLRKFLEAADNLTRMDELSSEDLVENSNRYLAHYYLGEIELAGNEHKKAARHYHKASMSYSTDTVARRYRIVQPSRATIFSKQGSALRHAQQIMEAVKAYKNALSVAETPKDKLAVHTSLGNLYQSLGENASALEQYENTVTLAEDLRDYVSLGWAYGNMGNACLGLYQKEKALKHLEKSLELTVEHEPSPQAIGRAYNNLGTAYQSLNELEKAEEYYDLALSQAIYGIDIGGQARVYGNYGNLLMIQKKYEPAITHYSEALGIGTDRSTRSTAHHNRGCAFYEKAETHKKKLLEITASDASSDFQITYGGANVKGQARALPLADSVRMDYISGRNDLTEVVAYHEETFQTIKGSSQGLTFSISLFETNSRTFHRLQDCLYNLGEWTKALEFAEQSRARTLGELLLQRKSGQLGMELSSPLKVEQVGRIITSVDTTVVFMSYTGARILTWVFTPWEGKVVTNHFQVALEDDQFDGKSLDQFLRYTLAEKLIDDSVEMYSDCSYEDSPQLTKLYQAFGKPLVTILDQFSDDRSEAVKDVILVPDSYTNLTPVVALLNKASQKFLGDRFCFRIMPSLLTLGILSQQEQVVVSVPEESHSFCIVGNPTIPTFKYQGETWNLGKLPFATQEAEAVAHILKATPTLHEQATKMVVLSMISGAKVIHLATHGSATAGFLALAGLGSSRSGSVSDEKLVLLYPEDIEKLSISPALVVLSSCDSGRGTMKADGIQGMARAFIVAGAQAVLTTLWRVPDESAAVFMQFFYQYMMDGFKGSRALRKAILSIRSFRKYSRYIHWSGYQLTGREIQFQVARNGASERMQKKLGPTIVFPRLDEVNNLEKTFIKDPYLPTDVQIFVGIHGLKPSEIVVEFVTNHYHHFTGGVFYINAENDHFVMGAEERIEKELTESSSNQPTLVIFESLASLPVSSSCLHSLLNRSSTHIIVTLHNDLALDSLRKQIDSKIMRGVNVVQLKPLSELQATQRLVHGIMSKCEFAPYNREQRMVAEIAEKTMGSPDLVELASALLSKYIEEEDGEQGFLEKFYNAVCCSECEEEEEEGEDPPLNKFAEYLLNDFDLSRGDFFLLSTLSLFGAVPIPRSLVEIVQLLAITASPELPNKLSPLAFLTSNHLLNVCPSTVIQSPLQHRSSAASFVGNAALTESDFYCVPQIIANSVTSCMDEEDRVFSFAAAHRSLNEFYVKRVKNGLDTNLAPFMAGLAKILADSMEKQEEMGKCYKEAYRTYLLYAIADTSTRPPLPL